MHLTLTYAKEIKINFASVATNHWALVMSAGGLTRVIIAPSVLHLICDLMTEIAMVSARFVIGMARVVLLIIALALFGELAWKLLSRLNLITDPATTQKKICRD